MKKTPYNQDGDDDFRGGEDDEEEEEPKPQARPKKMAPTITGPPRKTAKPIAAINSVISRSKAAMSVQEEILDCNMEEETAPRIGSNKLG